MITLSRLKELLHYDPETGDFTWVVRNSPRISVGSIAGTVHHQGYREIQIDGTSYRAHRLAWLYQTGDWPRFEIDHINRIRGDNRWLNLRDITHKENQENTGLRITNKSGVKGVSWHSRRKMWLARSSVGGVRKHVGYFETSEKAAEALA